MNPKSNTQEVYRLEIDKRNDGIVFYASPSTTLLQLMTFVCEEWLNDVRNGDGGVNDHLWKLSRPLERSLPRRDDFDDEDAFEDAFDEYVEAQDERDEGIPENTELQDITGLPDTYSLLKVMYDMGHTTYFDICFKAIETIPHDVEVPSLVQPFVEESFVPYLPPEGSPNLDNIYPNANRTIFQSEAAKWICPFPTSTTSAGFVEGGFKSTADIIFLPTEFSGIHEALVAMDVAMKKYPETEEYTRLAFPITMDAESEARFLEDSEEVNEYLEFRQNHPHGAFFGQNGNDISQLSENIRYRMWMPVTQANVRVTQEDLGSYKDAIDKNFPMCSKAYKRGLWASYRRGKVIVGMKKNSREPPEERGIPLTVLTKKAVEIDSLHQFFCVCEALFLQVDASRKYQSLLKNPALLSYPSEAVTSLE